MPTRARRCDRLGPDRCPVRAAPRNHWNPLVKLNHAVAAGMTTDPEDGLALIDRLAGSDELGGYRLMHAARADFLRRLGRNPEAAAAYREALKLARIERDCRRGRLQVGVVPRVSCGQRCSPTR